LGQLAPQRHLAEQLERPEAVGEGATDRWERAFGRDHALLNGGIAARSLQHRVDESLPRRGRGPNQAEHVEQHRLDHEAVVVVPVKRRPVPVHPVPLVPLLVLGEGIVHAQWYKGDRKSTRLNSSHVKISYAVFCLKKKKKKVINEKHNNYRNVTRVK